MFVSKECSDRANVTILEIEKISRIYDIKDIPVIDDWWKKKNNKLILRQAHCFNELGKYIGLSEKNLAINEIFERYNIESYFDISTKKDCTLLDIIVVCSRFKNFETKDLIPYLEHLNQMENLINSKEFITPLNTQASQKLLLQFACYSKVVNNRYFLYNSYSKIIKKLYYKIKEAYFKNSDNKFSCFEDEFKKEIKKIREDIILIEVLYLDQIAIKNIITLINNFLSNIEKFNYSTNQKTTTENREKTQPDSMISKDQKLNMLQNIDKLDVTNDMKTNKLLQEDLRMVVFKISYLVHWYIPVLQDKLQQQQEENDTKITQLLEKVQTENFSKIEISNDNSDGNENPLAVKPNVVGSKKKNVLFILKILLGGAALGGLGYLLYKKFKK